MKKVIGILGGMGPEATLDCFGKIIRSTPARKDQDHLRIVIDNNPNVPDRTSAIIGDGESPVPVVVVKSGKHAKSDKKNLKRKKKRQKKDRRKLKQLLGLAKDEVNDNADG